VRRGLSCAESEVNSAPVLLVLLFAFVFSGPVCDGGAEELVM
jgi:hypothetical protein